MIKWKFVILDIFGTRALTTTADRQKRSATARHSNYFHPRCILCAKCTDFKFWQNCTDKKQAMVFFFQKTRPENNLHYVFDIETIFQQKTFQINWIIPSHPSRVSSLYSSLTALNRKMLLDRLELEYDLRIGLRLLLLCLLMFAIVIYAAIVESQAPVRLGPPPSLSPWAFSLLHEPLSSSFCMSEFDASLTQPCQSMKMWCIHGYTTLRWSKYTTLCRYTTISNRYTTL